MLYSPDFTFGNVKVATPFFKLTVSILPLTSKVILPVASFGALTVIITSSPILTSLTVIFKLDSSLFTLNEAVFSQGL